MGTELDAGKIAILGLVATILVQAIKMISAWLKKDLGDKTVMVIVFVVSLILSFIWIMPLLPTQAWDIPSLIVFIVEQVGAVLGFSVVIYTLLLKLVFEKLNLTKARFIGKG